MNIGLIATDVDGTLVADDHLTIPPINIKSLRMAKENGIKIAISTGRPYSLTDREIAELGCVDYLVLSNGAAIVDAKTLEVLYSCYLPLKTMERVMKIFEKYPLVYEMYADGQGYITQYTYEHYFDTTGLPQVFLKDYRERMIVCDNLWDIIHTKNIEKLNVDYVPEGYLEPLMTELKEIPELGYSAGYKGNIEVIIKDADKGKALAWLAEYIGIKPENVMAFGDSGNDVTMLNFAGCSYAMLNGNKKAKEAADYITELNNDQGGVGETVKNYFSFTNGKK